MTIFASDFFLASIVSYCFCHFQQNYAKPSIKRFITSSLQNSVSFMPMVQLFPVVLDFLPVSHLCFLSWKKALKLHKFRSSNETLFLCCLQCKVIWMHYARCSLINSKRTQSISEEEIKNTRVAAFYNFSFKLKKIKEELQSWLKFTVNPFQFQNFLARLILHC